ncbi:hypothetical protein JCM11641_007751 [Rhodosporidiobolus odoratus]
MSARLAQASRGAVKLSRVLHTSSAVTFAHSCVASTSKSAPSAGRYGRPDGSNPAMSFPCVDQNELRTARLLEQRQKEQQPSPSSSKSTAASYNTLGPSSLASSATADDPDGPEPAYANVVAGYQVYDHPHPFPLDYGGHLPSFSLAYETWGTLNADKSNAVLLHTGLSASSHAHSTKANPAEGWWERFIGPGKALDTDKYFVICTNVLGGCYGSTGPSSLDPSDGQPYATRFPIISIFDMVRAQFKLLDHLGIGKLQASIGSSMGGMQSIAAAHLEPERVGKVVSISGTARSSPSSIAMRYAQRSVLMADPNWKRGFYYDDMPPHTGMKLARQIATITYRSGPEWEQRFARRRRDLSSAAIEPTSADAAHLPSPPVLCPDFFIETYLDHQGEAFCLKYDANSLIYVSKAMDLFDMSQDALDELDARRVARDAGVEPSDALCPIPPPKPSAVTQDPAKKKIKPFISSLPSSHAYLPALTRGLSRLGNIPVLIMGVQSDTLFPIEQQRELAECLKANGNQNVVYYELNQPWGHDTFLLEVGSVGGAVKGFLEHAIGENSRFNSTLYSLHLVRLVIVEPESISPPSPGVASTSLPSTYNRRRAASTAPEEARKRQRIGSPSTSSNKDTTSNLPSASAAPSSSSTLRDSTMVQAADALQATSSIDRSGASTNGHTTTSNGHSNGFGSGGAAGGGTETGTGGGNATLGDGALVQNGKRVVDAMQYDGNEGFVPLWDGSNIDRREFVRLALQAFEDMGYSGTAQTLQAESGFTLEDPSVTQFRQGVLTGSWSEVERLLNLLPIDTKVDQVPIKFAVRQQKFLEALEAQETKKALSVLRNELSPLGVDADRLHFLSSLIMCMSPDDLRLRAGWDGAGGSSRQQLLVELQTHISPSVMLPQHRLATLLSQAQSHQERHHAVRSLPSQHFSLLSDCDPEAAFAFPDYTSHVLQEHTDEVWRLAWSHDGGWLATAGKDKKVVLWKVRDGFRVDKVLREHVDPVSCLAWSPDDSVLLTAAENVIKMWNTASGNCIATHSRHEYPVGALAWLPNGQGFVSGGMDNKIFFWNLVGEITSHLHRCPSRIIDLAISPCGTKLVCVGRADMTEPHLIPGRSNSNLSSRSGTPASMQHPPLGARHEKRISVFGIGKGLEEGELLYELVQPQEVTSVAISSDSRYAIVSHGSKEILYINLDDGTILRKFEGHDQGQYVLRACFGGAGENLVLSGTGDGRIYVYHRDTGKLVHTLTGHGRTTVNAVAWNPHPPASARGAMWASCSDDRTVRIWEMSPPLGG